MSIVHLLIQFIFRVTFGVALAMTLTPPRLVSSGFFRVHLWVLMGLNTLAGLAVFTQREPLSPVTTSPHVLLGLAIALAVVSYLGAIFWLYEKTSFGRASLLTIVLGALLATVLSTHLEPASNQSTQLAWNVAGMISSGALLGFTLTAMFLGHWYLNTPTMDLMPLKRLVLWMGGAIIIRGIVNGAGLAFEIELASGLTNQFWIFLVLRWLSGLIGTFFLALLAWYSLKVPNTQSATGILYAGVIVAFIGELTSQFLSMDSAYPL